MAEKLEEMLQRHLDEIRVAEDGQRSWNDMMAIVQRHHAESVAWGRREVASAGGRTTSDKKTVTARENGAKGGYPKGRPRGPRKKVEEKVE